MAPFSPEVLPADYRKAYEGFSESARAAWLEQRLKGQIDHLYLGTELMAYDFQQNPHEALFREFLPKDPEQKKALYELDQKTKRRMIIWPRGLFKTSAIIAAIVQLILNFPNIRILLLSGSKPLTKRQLARAKKVFERPSKKFRQLYPEFCGDKLGDSEEFTVPCRSLDQLAEPTVAISTAKSVKAGSHFDVIFVDDLVNDQNYKSETALEKCWQEYCDIGPLLEPAGYMFITGTPYAPGDTYEKIEEDAKKEQEETGTTIWKFSTRSCYTDPQETQLLFPPAITRDGRQVGHTHQFLASERRNGEDFFARQYLCQRIVKSEQSFTPELLAQQTFFHLNVIPPEAATFMVGDLSYIGQEDRDLSVLFIVRVWLGLLWVVDSIAGKWDTDQAATNILRAILQYRPQATWLEGFLGWEAYNTVILGKAAALGIQQLPLSWIPMVNKKNAKMIRIGGVVWWLKQKKLWLFGGMPHYDVLCGQLKKFPKIGKRRDFADCLGLGCECPHGAAVQVVPKEYSTMDHIRQIHANQALRQDIDPFGVGGTGSGIVSG